MKYFIFWLIRLYQGIISPVVKQLTGMHSVCRYAPTCSSYFEESVAKYGIKGLWLGIKRIAHCHPFAKGVER